MLWAGGSSTDIMLILSVIYRFILKPSKFTFPKSLVESMTWTFLMEQRGTAFPPLPILPNISRHHKTFMYNNTMAKDQRGTKIL